MSESAWCIAQNLLNSFTCIYRLMHAIFALPELESDVCRVPHTVYNKHWALPFNKKKLIYVKCKLLCNLITWSNIIINEKCLY